ncbi:MAG: hypothetical protein AAF564_07505 [Bacteroidota bacterium]
MVDKDAVDVGNLHRILGIVMAMVFVATGAYMHFAYNGLDGMEESQKLLFRSAHIYILLSALVNIALGVHYWIYPKKSLRALQRVGSTLVALAPILFMLGFFNEPWLDELQRPFSGPGVYAIALGCLLHVLAFYLNYRAQTEKVRG